LICGSRARKVAAESSASPNAGPIFFLEADVLSKRKKRSEPVDDFEKESSRPEKEIGESRPSLAITVFWCLTALATLLTEVGVLVAGLALVWRKPIDEELHYFQRMLGMLFVASVVFGILLLLLIPLVYRFRDEPPPREITWTAAVIGGLPLVTGVMFFFFG